MSEPRGCIWSKEQATLIRPTGQSGAWQAKGCAQKHWPAPGVGGENREQDSSDPLDSEMKALSEEAPPARGPQLGSWGKREKWSCFKFPPTHLFSEKICSSVKRLHIGPEAHRTAQSRKGYSLQSDVLPDPYTGLGITVPWLLPFPLPTSFFLLETVSCIPAGWSKTH